MTGAAILVLGDVIRDVVVHLAGPLRPGTDQRATIETRPGGGGANLAAWLAAAGLPVRLLACVGAGDLDAEARRLRALGVEPALVASADRPTGQLIAIVGPDRDRSFLTDRGANDLLDPEALPADLLDGVGSLHLSGYSLVGMRTRRAALALLGRARDAGLPVSFDPGSSGFLAEVGAGAVLDWVGSAELCCLSADEALALTGLSDIDEQIATLAARFALVILKRGAAGVVAGDAVGRRWSHEAPIVAVQDTIGAGDAFLAGVLYARRTGGDVAAALTHGTAWAACALGQVGGSPPVVTGADRPT